MKRLGQHPCLPSLAERELDYLRCEVWKVPKALIFECFGPVLQQPPPANLLAQCEILPCCPSLIWPPSLVLLQDRLQAFARKVKKVVAEKELSESRRTLEVDVAVLNRVITHAVPDLSAQQRQALKEVRAKEEGVQEREWERDRVW